MVWPFDITQIDSVTTLLASVFVAGDADPHTSYLVMVSVASLIFFLMAMPKPKLGKRRQQQLFAITSKIRDERRLAGT